MKRLVLGLLVAALAVQPSLAWHPAAVVMPGVVGAGGATAGAAVVGGAIGALAVVMVVFDKSCRHRSNTWVDTRHDVYPKYHRYPTKCKQRKDPKLVAAAKLWPNGK